MNISVQASEVILDAVKYVKKNKLEYLTPEVVLLSLCKNGIFAEAFYESGGDIERLKEDLQNYIHDNIYSGARGETVLSLGTKIFLEISREYARQSDKDCIGLAHMVYSLLRMEDGYPAFYIKSQGVQAAELMSTLLFIEENDFGSEEDEAELEKRAEDIRRALDIPSFRDITVSDCLNPREDENEFPFEDEGLGSFEDMDELDDEDGFSSFGSWKKFAPCINDMVSTANPLIGREAELERTIQVLCRKDKNNPLHIGEPGVGKTALIYGLAQRINDGNVPEQLIGSSIFSLDMGDMLAGTHYRGDFEKRMKKVLSGVAKEKNPIVYIDEIHNIYGAGATGDSSFDASNLLKPYLTDGHIRFIGATTFEEYKKYFEKNKSLIRRFQNIEINEPDQEESVKILKGLKKRYEDFHGVTYDDEILEYIVQTSAKYINERFLPDKAIDIMDEAGAYISMHKTAGETKEPVAIDKEIVNRILSSICRVPVETVETEKASGLAELDKKLGASIFGQDEAITQVTNAVKFSKAGLLEEGKPLASLLFVGPTGVGKTEIARRLAQELGVKLVRFDMSEYTEKYTISKLIGSSAGYVGYENGGLLTEAIRKAPSSVLLLDEIEKAHEDIYNILLQVMDYATLTDNQGRKSDFRNVIIIMTSNVGADRVGKSTIGFRSEKQDNSAMMDEVKKTFKPEFRNRLSRIVIFNSMDDKMGESIVAKKLSELEDMLAKKDIRLQVDDKARALIKKKGISQEYGAREVERVIRNEIKPLFVDSILFGNLKNGGVISLTADGDVFKTE